MNENDLRDAFALMLTAGFAIKGEINPKAVWEIADLLVEARKEKPEDDGGIATIKKRKYVRKD